MRRTRLRTRRASWSRSITAGETVSKKFWWELPDGTVSLNGMPAADLPLYGSERVSDWDEDELIVLVGVGCSRRASGVLCWACFETLPFVGCPFCGRCGAPIAFEVLGCAECRDKDFAFEGACDSLGYEGVGGARARSQVRRLPPRRGEGNGAANGGCTRG